MKRHILVIAALSAVPFASVAHATPMIAVNITHDASPSPAPPTVSTTDLINQGRPSLGTVTPVNYTPYSTASISTLNDGTSGAWSNVDPQDTAVTTQSTDWSVIYNLIGSPTGYSISQVNVFSLWSNDFTSQNYSIGISTVSNPTFVSLVPDVLASDSTNEFASAVESLVTDSSGTLASGVTAIELTFHATPQSFQGNTPTDQAAYREIDVLGSATAVPEPTLLFPLITTALGFVTLRRAGRPPKIRA
jgi:hypothetical protein